MIIIDKIEVRYFRSLYNISLNHCADITAFTGVNDTGKSNVVKALNLFFNNRTDWGAEHDFEKDFSVSRVEEVKKAKGQKFISITITFLRGNKMENSLPPKFSVTRRWELDSRDRKQSSDVFRKMPEYCKKNNKKYSESATQRYLSIFLSRIEFIYIPAIKDNNVFAFVLRELQKNAFLSSDSAIFSTSIASMNETIASFMADLQLSFKNVTGIDSTIVVPKDFNISRGFLDVDTSNSNSKISLHQRGDGIKIHYIPEILNFISMHTKNKMYIWGFEEPENSFEYRRCLQIADDFEKKFSRRNQIFITTHSPAYYGNLSDKKRVFHLYKDKDLTKNSEDLNTEVLDSILGYSKLYEDFIQKVKILQQEQKSTGAIIAKLKSSIAGLTDPIILTEGASDELILITAKEKLSIPEKFIIKSCDTASSEKGAPDAGTGRLKSCLESHLDNDRTVIGIFDYDDAGLKAYNGLNKNFHESSIRLSSGVKVPYKKHRARNTYVICLPVPKEKQEYADAENLSIEFYFSNIDLDKKDSSGLSLLLEFSNLYVKDSKGNLIETKKDTALHRRKILENTKMLFAKNIVPMLDAKSFGCFKLLFEAICEFCSTEQGVTRA